MPNEARCDACDGLIASECGLRVTVTLYCTAAAQWSLQHILIVAAVATTVFVIVMNNGQWQNPRRQQYPHPQHAPMAVNTLQDAQDLLSMYPMASATPSAHGNLICYIGQ